MQPQGVSRQKQITNPMFILVLLSLCIASLVVAQTNDSFTPSSHLGAKLPDFKLKDLAGRTWTPADLAGKTVFINIWATWCKPCNAELPYVQKLADKIKGRQDIIMLTFNVDEKPEKVAPFVANKKYEFPVLFAYSLIRTEMKLKGIPRNWVLNTSGVIKVDEFGYEGRTDWVEWAEKQIDTVMAK